jgi:hypothetical protein
MIFRSFGRISSTAPPVHRYKVGISLVLLFVAFTSCALSEGFSMESGQIPQPGPLVMPSVSANDVNGPERAIEATIEKAAEIMGGIGREPKAADLDPAAGAITPDSAQSLSLLNGTFDEADIADIAASATWTGLSGAVTYKQTAMMDNQGRRHVFVIGTDNALYDNVDGSWIRLGGYLTSAPYPAKDVNGKIHIFARGSDYGLYDFVFDTESWTGCWRGLGGYLNSLPTAVMEPTYGVWMKIAVMGSDGGLYICDFNVNDLSTRNWYGKGGVSNWWPFIIVNSNLASRMWSWPKPCLNWWPFIMVDSNSRLHTFIRGSDNSLYDNRGVLSSGIYYHTWYGLGGAFQDSPFAIQEPGRANYVAVTIRGSDNALYVGDVNALADPETCTWYYLGGVISSEPFMSTDTANRIHTFVRGGDGTMYENVFTSWIPTGAKWFGYGGGIHCYSPWALLDGQTYAYIWGTDNSIYRMIYTTTSPSTAESPADSSGKTDISIPPEARVEGATGASGV